jgi:UDP-N-acetylglucosamine 2-epimerase (non-hydrolysing)
MSYIVQVVAARPNFVKMAPIIDALARRPDVRQCVVHTGQHYDAKMSSEMLSDLGFPEPDVFLGAGSGRHGEQTAKVLAGFEQVLLDEQPDAVVVAGDVNSTLAAALAASKLGIPIAHVESGLRSFDWTMPEEINRILTDRLSDLLLTHSPEAADNLRREGIHERRVRLVGNTMIDSLRRFEAAARGRLVWERLGLRERAYVLVTLHRPSNVDSPPQLAGIVSGLSRLARECEVVFPIHPRTRARLERDGQLGRLERAGVIAIPPASYLDFLSLELGAGAIVTDSGGIQEEASALGVDCYTLRANTERPVTIELGTNTLLGDDPRLLADVRLSGHPPAPCLIPLWDGHAGERAAQAILTELGDLDTARVATGAAS